MSEQQGGMTCRNICTAAAVVVALLVWIWAWDFWGLVLGLVLGAAVYVLAPRYACGDGGAATADEGFPPARDVTRAAEEGRPPAPPPVPDATVPVPEPEPAPMPETTIEPEPAPAPEPEPAPEPAAPGAKPAALDAPRGGAKDDLKKIKGVGPKLEEQLNAMGYFHYDQVAAWSADEVAWMDENMPGLKGRVSRDGWVDQARALAAGDGS
jgi:NADH-quinone oxidoreductase subunit E